MTQTVHIYVHACKQLLYSNMSVIAYRMYFIFACRFYCRTRDLAVSHACVVYNRQVGLRVFYMLIIHILIIYKPSRAMRVEGANLFMFTRKGAAFSRKWVNLLLRRENSGYYVIKHIT